MRLALALTRSLLVRSLFTKESKRSIIETALRMMGAAGIPMLFLDPGYPWPYYVDADELRSLKHGILFGYRYPKLDTFLDRLRWIRDHLPLPGSLVDQTRLGLAEIRQEAIAALDLYPEAYIIDAPENSSGKRLSIVTSAFNESGTIAIPTSVCSGFPLQLRTIINHNPSLIAAILVEEYSGGSFNAFVETGAKSPLGQQVQSFKNALSKETTFIISLGGVSDAFLPLGTMERRICRIAERLRKS